MWNRDVKDEIKENKCFLRGYNLFLSRVMFGILTLFVHCERVQCVCVSAHCVQIINLLVMIILLLLSLYCCSCRNVSVCLPACLPLSIIFWFATHRG